MTFADLVEDFAAYNYAQCHSKSVSAPAWEDVTNKAERLYFIAEAGVLAQPYEEVFKDHERFKRQFESCVTPTDEAGEYTERVYQNIQKLSDLHEENSTEVTIDEYRKAYDDAVQE